MLSVLHIENIAVIESADIQFNGGFNVLTGETGAGKSIVVDAIGAVLGGRTSRDLVRTGAKSALVCAEFIALPDLAWFQENGMGPDEDGTLMLQREIRTDGKNLCRLNGRPITLAQLRTLGCQLLNIHGQHDGQQLLDPTSHLSYLDSFGELEDSVADYQESYRGVAALKRQISALQMDEAEKERKIDSLTYQIQELERAHLKPDEDTALSQRREALRNAGKLIEATDRAFYALYGGEDSDGAISLLTMAEQALRSGGRYSEPLGEIGEKLTELRYQLDDLAEQVRDERDSLDISPNELDALESRLDVIYRLRKKYGDTVADMLDYLEHCKKELDNIQYSSDKIEHLSKKLETQRKNASVKGKELTEKRKASALLLQNRIQKELMDLDMPKVRFEVQFEDKTCEFGMDDTGMDEVQFLMSANVGEDLKPIQKIASGGELARIMLALKNVLAENEEIGTLVFDEVDTGVSGRAATKVAKKMAEIANQKQVLTVTHLPQIAAMADVHFSVEKAARKGRTFTDVEELSRERRMEELARLTGGSVVTTSLLQSAGELLDEARQFKEAL